MQQTANDYKEQVMQALKWDALQYGQFQYDMGLQFLIDNMLGGDETWMDEITRCKIYWQWWKNQWNIRDKQFIETALYSNDLQSRVAYYQYTNNSLTLRCRPHRAVMEETYAVMMGQFIDETLSQPC